MQRHHSYPYAYPAPSQARYSTHSTSSAQSPSANPDEDWTKISDLAERRRIQNRIAQRNYRKKLKRRLEDLERRAGSSSASPEQQPAEILPSQVGRDDKTKRRASKPNLQSSGARRSPIPPTNSQFTVRDDQGNMFSRQYTRQLSASPPPTFTYSSYAASEPPQPVHAPYPQHAPYHTLPAPYPDYQTQTVYLPPLPMTRPNFHSYDGSQQKPEGQYGEDDMISHFNISYSSVSGIEVPTTQSYADSTPYTPSLSDTNSFGHSRATSPSEQSLMCLQTPGQTSVSPRAVMGY